MSRFNRITCRSLRATLRLELTATGAFLMTLPHVAELALEMATRWALDSSERSGLRQSRAVIRSLLYLLPCRILGLVLSNDRLAAAAELEIAWGDTRSRQTRLGRDQDTTETIRVSSKHGCRRRRRGVTRMLANRARLAMVERLMDGRAHPAGDLAREAGVALSTASGHLSELAEAGLVEIEPAGEQRRYRLSRPEVARAIRRSR